MNSSVSCLLSSSVAISISKRSSKWAKPIIYPKPSCLRLSAKPRTTTSSTTTLVSSDESTDNLVLIKSSKKRINSIVIRSNKKVKEAEMKERWLDSLSTSPLSSTSSWVVGVDPDVSGAIALLKPVFVDDGDGGHNPAAFSAQVFDSPHVTILIGNRSRRRLDAKSIVNLLKSFDAPIGTTAYVEQSTPFPQDGKQGWWSGGFGYGLWIGTLVASGFSVVPVPSVAWKNKFCLSGSRSSKDDSRELASTLFPTICPLLKRKKDHGRAEALLIAAYGRGMNLSTDLQGITEDLIVT